MLLYVFLILLPATALAECPRAVLTALFVALDTNKDNNIDLQECVNLFSPFDVNKDGAITVDEAEQVAPDIAPPFVGHVPTLVDFLDINRDGKVTMTDVLLEFYCVDRNKDAVKSKSEYDRYADGYCRKVDGKNGGLMLHLTAAIAGKDGHTEFDRFNECMARRGNTFFADWDKKKKR